VTVPAGEVAFADKVMLTGFVKIEPPEGEVMLTVGAGALTVSVNVPAAPARPSIRILYDVPAFAEKLSAVLLTPNPGLESATCVTGKALPV